MLPPELVDRNNLRSMMLACATLARTDISATVRERIDELREDIELSLLLLSSMLALRKRDGWSAGTQAPGYVIRSFENGLNVHVPFHLIDDIPSPEVLEELVKLATQVASDDATICLSGSASVYGALQTVGDCDFCEYVDVDRNSDAMVAASESVRRLAEGSPLALALVGWDGDVEWEVSRPWPNPIVAAAQISSSLTIMGHYFAETRFEGALEVTKLTIPLASSSLDSKKRSFPAQELPTTKPPGWLPRVLSDPTEISAYVVFLLGQLAKYERTDQAKALKRALSLARILFLDSDAEEIRNGLSGSEVLLVATLRARAEFAARVKQFELSAAEKLQERVVDTIKKLCTRSSRVEVRNAAGLPAGELIRTLQELPPELDQRVSDLLRNFANSVDTKVKAAVY